MEYRPEEQPLLTPVGLPKIPQEQGIYSFYSGGADRESSGHEHSSVQNIEHQDAKRPLLTPADPPEISQEQENCGLAFEGSGEGFSRHGHYPVQTDIPEYCDKHRNNLNLVASLAAPRSPSWGPPTDTRGFSFGAWRTGCAYFAIIAAAVFLINYIFTAWALSTYGYDSGEGIGTLFMGSCKSTATLNSVAHILINALSTVLLSASNYTMQCLSAPTREEIDTAHRGKKWLDIGAPSVRNLCSISRLRVILFCLLAMSSVPLHFLYNSAIISTITTYPYTPWVMREMNITIDKLRFKNLEKKKCIELYGKQYITDRSDVVVVIAGDGPTDYFHPGVSVSDAGDRPTDYLYSNDTISNDTISNDTISNDTISNDTISNDTISNKPPDNSNYLPTGSKEQEHFAWICQFYPDSDYPFCDTKTYLAQVDSWKINGTEVLYCLSMEMDERCLLQYSLNIMVVVLICNAVKCVCILLAISSKGSPLMTVGDAIVSFIDTPDGTTVGMCIVSKKDIKDGIWGNTAGGIPQVLRKDQKPFWFRAGGFGRWIMCYVLSLIALGTALWGFICGYNNLKSSYVKDPSHWWGLGLGAVDRRLMIEGSFFGGSDYLLGCVFSANLPQVIFSFLYLLYNSLFTCMLLGLEWDRFSHQYRPLRVTTPVGEQKSIPFLQKVRAARPADKQGSTYYLQLPYRYSIPLMVTSGLVHWLISQSIFITRISVGGSFSSTASSLVGWSPAAIVLAITASTLMLVVAILTGFRRYRGEIPLVGSCSAAISAACHPDPSEAPVGTGPVKWGVVGSNNDGVGHCSFSNSNQVTAPVPGQPYAGQRS